MLTEFIAARGDLCDFDPAKSVPGVCGCGVADVDVNGNGVTDCLTTDEMREQLTALKKALARVKTARNKKQVKQQKLQKKLVLQLLGKVGALNTAIAAGSTNPSASQAGAAFKSLTKKVKGALKTKHPEFKKLKKKAAAAIAQFTDYVLTL